ncbi:hypothetical protein Y032_0050g1945 [Ancylostoma ceylanicum]|uniref:Uncharacterized protein n=1 Tax=Ancylostoma ceylanicum TaxID=53326 RepID=A0A016U864_9BILA|nr:hypothetical protein Y032_0050g1945 [Ancylostoma ceylanicum]
MATTRVLRNRTARAGIVVVSCRNVVSRRFSSQSGDLLTFFMFQNEKYHNGNKRHRFWSAVRLRSALFKVMSESLPSTLTVCIKSLIL